jgi:LacI family transcriptional regulator
VSVDDAAGGRIAAEHLLGIGRRRIAFVGGPMGIQQVADRLAGAREAVAATPGARLELFETTALTVLEGRRVGAELLAGDRPDAILAANDLVATGLLQALVMDGSVRVPDDIALIGYDDIDFAASAMVPLSSVRQPAELIGRTAVRILLEEEAEPGAQPRNVVFQPELVVRESTRGAAATRS